MARLMWLTSLFLFSGTRVGSEIIDADQILREMERDTKQADEFFSEGQDHRIPLTTKNWSEVDAGMPLRDFISRFQGITLVYDPKPKPHEKWVFVHVQGLGQVTYIFKGHEDDEKRLTGIELAETLNLESMIQDFRKGFTEKEFVEKYGDPVWELLLEEPVDPNETGIQKGSTKTTKVRFLIFRPDPTVIAVAIGFTAETGELFCMKIAKENGDVQIIHAQPRAPKAGRTPNIGKEP